MCIYINYTYINSKYSLMLYIHRFTDVIKLNVLQPVSPFYISKTAFLFLIEWKKTPRAFFWCVLILQAVHLSVVCWDLLTYSFILFWQTAISFHLYNPINFTLVITRISVHEFSALIYAIQSISLWDLHHEPLVKSFRI